VLATETLVAEQQPNTTKAPRDECNQTSHAITVAQRTPGNNSNTFKATSSS